MSNITTSSIIPPMERQGDVVSQATFIAKSKFIPVHYQNDVGACILAINSSMASGIPIAQIMNGSYLIKGKPSYYGKFVIALVNRKFNSTLQFQYIRDNNNKVISCQAWLKTRDGSLLEGATVTQEMAIAENWIANNPKWTSMPELMYMYRAGSFFASVYAPEVLMGGSVEGEVEDTRYSNNSSNITNITPTTPQLKNEADSIIDVKQ